MRKLFSIVLALLMAFSFTAMAFAQGTNNPELERVVDYADIFSDAEEDALEAMIWEVIGTYGMDLVVYTDDDAHGKDIVAGADDFYDEQGYGCGEMKSGSLLYICFDPSVRSWYTSTCGKSIEYFDYDNINIIDDAMEPFMLDGYFFEAVSTHIEYVSELYSKGSLYNQNHEIYNGEGYSRYEGNHEQQSEPEPVWKTLLAALFFGLFIGLVAGLAARKKAIASMTTVGVAGRADEYTIPGGFRLSRAENIFLTMSISRVPKVQHNNNGGMHSGGSSFTGGHISSGGSFHSGGGGRHF